MANTSDNNASTYDIFTRSQQQLFDQWAKTLETFQQAQQIGQPSPNVAENTRQFFKLYDSWKENIARHFDVLMSACPGNAGTDTFSKLFRATDAYVRLYEFWEPLTKALQERALDLDSYKNLVDPAKYGETVAAVFGFGSPTAMSDLQEHASHLVETWGAKGQDILKPWSDAMRTSMEASLAAASGDPEASLAALRGLYSAFESTIGEALKMPAIGKDREHIELVLRTLDRYVVFLAKNAELQRQMSTIAQTAMEKVVQTMAEEVKKGEPIKGYGDFVKLWTTINEETFLEFFRTEQFSELQGMVLDTALDCRREFQQLMEVYLKDFPIALRSEMDDVSKTNYSLNKSVRALQKKTAEVDTLKKELKNLTKRVATLEKELATDEESKD